MPTPTDAPKNDDAPGQEPKATTPPWGDDFDAARAWTLVQNLRAERDEIKAERDSLKAAATAAEDAEKTELQKALDRVAALEKDASTAQRDLWIERATRKHSLPEEVVEFLTGDTAEEIEAKAERLATLGKAKEPGNDDKGADKGADTDADAGSSLPGRPAPALTPGHGNDGGTPNDLDAIANAARSRF